MKNSNSKWLMGGLIGFTVILLATAAVLYLQLNKPVETVPSPKPKPAASVQMPEIKEAGGLGVCELAFTIPGSPSPSPSTSPSPSPSGSPSPISCFDKCSVTGDCSSGLQCLTVAGNKRCVNPNCTEDTDCVCPGAKKDCWDKCENSNDCEDDLSCSNIPGTNDKRCVNTSCIMDTDCTCSSASPSPSVGSNPPISYASIPPRETKGGQPVLPEAGISGPAVLGVSAGLLLILGALLF